MASCQEIKRLINAYVDGEAGDDESLKVEGHIRDCQSCRGELEATRLTASRLFEAFAPARLDHDMTQSVMMHLPDMDTGNYGSHELPERIKHPNRPQGGLRWAMSWLPVFTPVVLLLMGFGLLMVWPKKDDTPGRVVGKVLLEQGKAAKTHELLARESAVREKENILTDTCYQTNDDSVLVLGLIGPTQVRVFGDTGVTVAHDRELRLQSGEIFLDVSKGDRYFRVNTPDGLITVFGTSFSVAVDDAGTVVKVVHGQVQVENRQAFVILRAGEQTHVRQDMTTLVARSAEGLDALAEKVALLRPNLSAEAAFNAMPKQVNPKVFRAEQVFVVETLGHAVAALHFEWTPDPYVSGHASYNVYISDSNMRPLFKGRIDASVFSDKTMNHHTVAIPKGLMTDKSPIYHIRVLPDYTSGTLDTPFVEVTATSP